MVDSLSFKQSGLLWIDPRTKLMMLFIVSFTVLHEMRLVWQTGSFAFALILLLNGGLYVNAMRFCLWFGALVVLDLGVVQRVTSPIVYMLGGIVVFVRMFFPLFMVFTLLIQTTRVSEFLAAFDRMHLPDKIKIPFSVMFRFFPTMGEEWNSIQSAMRLRGISLNLRNLIARPAQVFEYTLVPLLANSALIADEISVASLSRGLGAKTRRTCLTKVGMGVFDYLVLAISLGFAVASMSAY